MIFNIVLQTDYDRSNVSRYVAQQRALGKFTILEVGGFLPMKGIRADAIVDIQDPKIPGTTLFQGNISMPEVWSEVREYVHKHGKFDFCLCSHTLEDIGNPELACDRIQEVAKAGFIAVPSRFVELSRFEGPYRGYIHHRWIFTINRYNEFVGFPKINFIDFFQDLDLLEDKKILDLSFFWKGKIGLKLVNNDFLGPTVQDVISYYREGLFNDYFTKNPSYQKLAYAILPNPPIVEKVKNSNHFFDIGANEGNTFELFLNDHPQYLNWNVWCFEPSPRNQKKLLESVKNNDNNYNITICPFGLAGKTTSLPFYQMSNSNQADSFIKEGLFATLDNGNNYKILGWVVSITDFIKENTKADDTIVLKIDCEGSEYDIHNDLLSKPEILKRISIIYNEWHPSYTDMTEQKKKLTDEIIRKYGEFGKALTPWMF